jgi:hypothetical protein
MRKSGSLYGQNKKNAENVYVKLGASNPHIHFNMVITREIIPK